VDVIPVGTGKALKLAEGGDVDVTLVHAPELEKLFVKRGFGVNRRYVMYNDFVIVGPPQDVAGIKGASDARGAFRRIAERTALFISRGDRSGTHTKELSLWKKAGVNPSLPWYLESGRGMGVPTRKGRTPSRIGEHIWPFAASWTSPSWWKETLPSSTPIMSSP